KNNLLIVIEWFVKKNILHIIEYESEIAINSKIATNKEDFIENISTSKDWINYFYGEYPLLKTYIKAEYAKVKKNIHVIFNALNSDYKELGYTRNTKLCNIEFGEGDMHFGQCTCKLSFSNSLP